jgi:hypothetical protein
MNISSYPMQVGLFRHSIEYFPGVTSPVIDHRLHQLQRRSYKYTGTNTQNTQGHTPVENTPKKNTQGHTPVTDICLSTQFNYNRSDIENAWSLDG